MENNSYLVLFYGPNGVGKTTIARALATQYNGLHVQIDVFSAMQRGKFWHTRKNNKDKMTLVLAVLDAALLKTSYCRFFVDGVLIYRFMFRQIDDWCRNNKIKFIPVYLTGKLKDLDYRVQQRKKIQQDWNKKLPTIYKNFNYRPAIRINSSSQSAEQIVKMIISLIKRKGGD
ncbi:AAA family ATPase [Candidatus Wolfebacteria bacterium]|nr:AAA family ATPase [Candidatus Wolfebacteria bacterium]